MDIFDITASALSAQRLRMDVVSSNLANVNTTRNADGTPGVYKRKNVVFQPVFDNTVSKFLNKGTSSADLAGSLPMKASSGVHMGPNGKPYLRATVSNFQSGYGGVGVAAGKITNSEYKDMKPYQIPGHPDADENGYVMLPKDMKMVHDPSHPDAIQEGELAGYVILPNVNPVTEMVDMISATRAYEANISALQSAKKMMQSALDI